MINDQVLSSASDLRRRFQAAKPFKHLCIDDFFELSRAERLLLDFPSFEARNALNEFGEVGGKAVVTTLKDVSPFYARVYDYVLSAEFLEAMSSITGIPGLLPDARMYGGGTHENVHGQELDPHVDFNYDLDHGYHRRLNLILYLNKDWDESWGGAIELHSNPRRPDANEVRAFNGIFNRAVIFETSEHSWHGFKRVQLPASQRSRSRKSLSIYLYTRERPQEEIAPPHGTFYVPRPLPFDMAPETALTADQIAAVRAAIHHRDRWIEHYQDLELRLSGQVELHSRYIKHLLAQTRAPISGLAKSCGESSGMYPDGGLEPHAAFSAQPLENAGGFIVRGYVPEYFPVPMEIAVRLCGVTVASKTVSAGHFEIPVTADLGTPTLRIEIITKKSFNGAKSGVNSDARDLAFLLRDVEFTAERWRKHDRRRTWMWSTFLRATGGSG